MKIASERLREKSKLSMPAPQTLSTLNTVGFHLALKSQSLHTFTFGLSLAFALYRRH
jgi:hypothetical protein